MNGSIRAREGDFLETVEGLIFDVKGLVHPSDRVIAFLRYIESLSGDRVRDGKKYIKIYSLSTREEILRDRYPHYIYYDEIFGDWLEGVPNNLIAKLYEPSKKVSDLLNKSSLDIVEAEALKFIFTLHEYSNVSLKNLGLSGSVLVDLHSSESDIDAVVYGRRNCFTVHEWLRTLMDEEKGGFSPYSLSDLRRLYDFRSKDTSMPFERFCEVERRKAYQGKFLGRDFFVRFIPDWDEVDESYGERLYRNAGYAKIKARIEDDSCSIFTPCKYAISEIKILEGTDNIRPLREIVSFRGRFCEQARRGEWIIAQGKVEKVIENDGSEYYRMILGAKPSDFMILESSIL
ncbi:hypothetical protein KEJ17_07585 [Candidatus Bathyarchaeota archaeon]|nr:hypothetical protein [Candidatus Bathyarchaeota archaeon]